MHVHVNTRSRSILYVGANSMLSRVYFLLVIKQGCQRKDQGSPQVQERPTKYFNILSKYYFQFTTCIQSLCAHWIKSYSIQEIKMHLLKYQT